MDGNGTIDFEEFLLLFKFKEKPKPEYESNNHKDKQLLDLFDKDKTGFLSPNEWMEVKIQTKTITKMVLYDSI